MCAHSTMCLGVFANSARYICVCVRQDVFGVPFKNKTKAKVGKITKNRGSEKREGGKSVNGVQEGTN